MKVSSTALFALLPILANAFSLGDIQKLPDNLEATPSCKSTYNKDITQCTILDLKSTCSEGCTKALKKAASDLILACRQSKVDEDVSLLYVAMNAGSLEEAICGGQGGGDDSDDEDDLEEDTKTSKTSPKQTSTLEPTQIVTDSTEPTPSGTEDENSSETTPAAAGETTGSGNNRGGADLFSLDNGNGGSGAAGLRVGSFGAAAFFVAFAVAAM